MGWVVADVGQGQWTSLLTPEVIIALLIVLLVLLLIAAITGLIVYRRFQRSPKWGRRVLALQAEYAPEGPRRDVLRLILQLYDAIDGA